MKVVEVVVGMEEHPRCYQAKGSKVKEKLVHLTMVVKLEVLNEKKKMYSLGLMMVRLVNRVLDGAFGGVRGEDVVVGEGVVNEEAFFGRIQSRKVEEEKMEKQRESLLDLKKVEGYLVRVKIPRSVLFRKERMAGPKENRIKVTEKEVTVKFCGSPDG
ncbi:hypothetical protein Tco_0907443, partial [Tanacetum coccineum]